MSGMEVQMSTIKLAGKWIVLGLCLTVSAAFAQHSNRVDLGRLQTGAAVSFVRGAGGGWGIEISGAPRMMQPKPVQIEVFRGKDIVDYLACGYQSVQKRSNAVVAMAKVVGEDEAGFGVEDRWTISGDVLSVVRKAMVTGTEHGAGFYSAIRLSTGPAVKWRNSEYFSPGLLYGKPHTVPWAPGGSLHYRAKYFSIREDFLSAPLFGILFHNGSWVAELDPTPNGATTLAETTAPATTPIIDGRIRFGALDARKAPGGGIEIGFRMPGTTDEFSGGFFGGGAGSSGATPVVRRRYHPVKEGFTQDYQVRFRFGRSGSFGEMERDAWRWAWRTLKPRIMSLNVKVVYRTLIDNLANRVVSVDGRAGIPFVIDAVSGRPGSFRPVLLMKMIRRRNPAFAERFDPRHPTPHVATLAKWAKSIGIDMDPKAAELELWPKITMGFCGKNIEAAGQFLMESDHDRSPRGRRMRKLGLMIINSFLHLDPMSPALSGEGFDIHTGKASAVRGKPSFSLRATGEGMRAMFDAYRRERAHGRLHPSWLAWVKSYCDWLLTKQRPDGSFPETFQGGTGSVIDSSGATSYAAVPVLVRMTRETGDKRYLNSAIRAADYIWTNYGRKCVFIGATGGDVADKESGMLSMEAFLDLYQYTKNSAWLTRAETAGNYAESWIWIWNVPMPIGAEYSKLGWKPGVPTVGVTGIASNGPGAVDEYLDWATSCYARLYEYTKDKHYLYVARVLLHDTKTMLALPGRTYDLKGPGWQQEHWMMGPGPRGVGAHRTWLPWITVNHLHSITGVKQLGKKLFQEVSETN